MSWADIWQSYLTVFNPSFVIEQIAYDYNKSTISSPSKKCTFSKYNKI